MAAIHPPPKGPSAGVFWQKSHKSLTSDENYISESKLNKSIFK